MSRHLFLALLVACDAPRPDTMADGAMPDGATAATCIATARRDLVPASQAPACVPARIDRDIAYAGAPDDLDGPFRLDLYRPASAGPFRTLIWIHGGGWQSGDEDNANQATRLACAGWAVASVDYRLTTEGVVFPTPLSDVKAAIRFLRAHASSYDLDPARFVAFGSSAGGHLAALVGTSAGVDSLEDLALGNSGTPSTVSAAAVWYGPTDLGRMDSQLADVAGCGPGHHAEADSPESALVGCTVGDASCAPAIARANPLAYIDPSDPPFLVMHGTSDCNVPIGQSEILVEALRASSICVDDYAVTGAGHGGTAWTSSATQDVLRAYLDRVVPL